MASTCSLHCTSLSIRSLPCRAINIIREYCCPLTRPDWRKLRKMTNYNLFHCITNDNIPYRLLNIINTNMQTSDWFCMFTFIELWGANNASIRYGIPTGELIRINGLNYAVNNYVNMNEQIRKIRN